ncbi:threonine ammonia-lyase IlvA [Chryseomicrobium palamuruense]|uniref:L-threonine dehydratase n=1 Tax=Chryseomicrobium palamuruense TaxID=682973 RepID=A0ABV8UVU3_9BACL
MVQTDEQSVKVEDVIKAYHQLKDIVIHTPLQRSELLSKVYDAEIYLKREDLQVVRSFKLRGAYYKIATVEKKARERHIVCASAGNHAQGVAYACSALQIQGTIFMPKTTPKQKVNQVRMFGADFVEIRLEGDTFDDSAKSASHFSQETGALFIHPFDDPDVMAGQGTVAVEILQDSEGPVDMIVASIGGGGLIAGMASYIKNVSPQTILVGAEPAGAASMKAAFEAERPVSLERIDKFVDGAAVQCVGNETFQVAFQYVDKLIQVPEGKVCTTILEMYNQHAIVVEPAGALPIAALESLREDIRGKKVVLVVSGGNNDISRMQEIKEKSLLYEGYLHYFLVKFPQRSGALRQFLHDVLGPEDDITTFEYTKKNNKESGPALIGIELHDPEDYPALIERLKVNGFEYKEVNNDSILFELLI